MYDLDNDGKKEILIDWDHIKENIGIRFYTAIYTPDSLTSVNEPSSTINDYMLEQNFPNPFNLSTQVRFVLPNNSKVSIKVYNLLGKEIATLLDKEMSPGNYTVIWEAKDSDGKLIPSGVYLIRFMAGNYTKTIKAVLLK